MRVVAGFAVLWWLLSATVVYGEETIRYHLDGVQSYQMEEATFTVQGKISGTNASISINGYLYVESDFADLVGEVISTTIDQSFPSYAAMVAVVKHYFCHEEKRPSGDVYFRSRDYHKLLADRLVRHGKIGKTGSSFGLRVYYNMGDTPQIINFGLATCEF